MDTVGKILVIEDDRDIRESLRELLESEGYRVKSAAHGREGIELLTQGMRPTLILLDLSMPVMDGWEFMQFIQSSPSMADIPVVVISASGQAKMALVQASAYLHKPLNVDRFLELVESYVSGVTGGFSCAETGLPVASLAPAFNN